MKICRLNSAKLAFTTTRNSFCSTAHYSHTIYRVWYGVVCNTESKCYNNNKERSVFALILSGKQFVYIKLNIDSNPSNIIFIDPTDLNVYGFLEQKQRLNKIQNTEWSADRLDHCYISNKWNRKLVFANWIE